MKTATMMAVAAMLALAGCCPCKDGSCCKEANEKIAKLEKRVAKLEGELRASGRGRQAAPYGMRRGVRDGGPGRPGRALSTLSPEEREKQLAEMEARRTQRREMIEKRRKAQEAAKPAAAPAKPAAPAAAEASAPAAPAPAAAK